MFPEIQTSPQNLWKILFKLNTGCLCVEYFLLAALSHHFLMSYPVLYILFLWLRRSAYKYKFLLPLLIVIRETLPLVPPPWREAARFDKCQVIATVLGFAWEINWDSVSGLRVCVRALIYPTDDRDCVTPMKSRANKPDPNSRAPKCMSKQTHAHHH